MGQYDFHLIQIYIWIHVSPGLRSPQSTGFLAFSSKYPNICMVLELVGMDSSKELGQFSLWRVDGNFKKEGC